jgi:hypothetical protein
VARRVLKVLGSTLKERRAIACDAQQEVAAPTDVPAYPVSLVVVV